MHCMPGTNATLRLDESARGWGTRTGHGKLDQVELKPLPTLRIALGIALFIEVTISHGSRLGIAPPDPTLHPLILQSCPRDKAKGYRCKLG